MKDHELEESPSKIEHTNKTVPSVASTEKSVLQPIISSTAKPMPSYIFSKDPKRHRQPRLPKYYRELPYYYYSPLYVHGHIPEYYTPQYSFEATNMIDYIY